MVVAEIEVVHVGRGIDAAQRAVELERWRVEIPRRALRDLHLHAVAGEDVILAAPYGGEELLLGDAALQILRPMGPVFFNEFIGRFFRNRQW